MIGNDRWVTLFFLIKEVSCLFFHIPNLIASRKIQSSILRTESNNNLITLGQWFWSTRYFGLTFPLTPRKWLNISLAKAGNFSCFGSLLYTSPFAYWKEFHHGGRCNFLDWKIFFLWNRNGRIMNCKSWDRVREKIQTRFTTFLWEIKFWFSFNFPEIEFFFVSFFFIMIKTNQIESQIKLKKSNKILKMNMLQTSIKQEVSGEIIERNEKCWYVKNCESKLKPRHLRKLDENIQMRCFDLRKWLLQMWWFGMCPHSSLYNWIDRKEPEENTKPLASGMEEWAKEFRN